MMKIFTAKKMSEVFTHPKMPALDMSDDKGFRVVFPARFRKGPLSGHMLVVVHDHGDIVWEELCYRLTSELSNMARELNMDAVSLIRNIEWNPSSIATP